ncbi:MAG: hypothetical protein EOM21_13055 [Gammaproteobacteria bacterium]|nr:hypothetical protein [Gammaproteobacteria bacterium]
MNLADLQFPPTPVETVAGMTRYRLDPREKTTAAGQALSWFLDVCDEWFWDASGNRVDDLAC